MATVPVDNQTLMLAAELILGGFFILSGVLKLKDLDSFASIAASYAIVPDSMQNLAKNAAKALPFVEIVFGAALVAGFIPLVSALIIGLSLVMFIAANIYEMLENPNRPNCGCFGASIEVELSWAHVLLNIGLLIMALYIASASV